MCAARVQKAALGAGRMWSWRAHSYGGVSELRLEAARVPALRAGDELLVRVHSSSLNPLDVAMLDGYGRRALGAWRRAEEAWRGVGDGDDGVESALLPLTPGRDFSGEVVRAGPDAERRAGDLVWGVLPPHRPGAHQEYVVVDDQWVCSAPAPLRSVEAGGGGALYAGLTALALLAAAGVRAGERGAARGNRVLLLGLGGVGQAALQILRHAGATVTVVCSGESRELALQLGAAQALDRHAPDYPLLLRAAEPYSAVLDCAGVGAAGARGGAAPQCARYVTLSSPALRLTDESGLCAGAARAALELAKHNASLGRSPAEGGVPPQVRWAFFTPSRARIELLRRLAERGEWRVPVERVFAWWRADEAYARAQLGHARGKLLLDFTQSAPPDALPPPPAARRH